MHDIWNPWHGCVKKSEGCDNCYMFFLDRAHGLDGREIRRNRAGFAYPLRRNRAGGYVVRSGETIRVCMTSDFFLAEADPWRPDAWRIMAARPDVKFFLLTKRPERVAACLPPDWGDGWENIFFNVSAENQRRADERVPVLLDLPFRHKGIMCAPFIGPVTLREYLKTGAIEQVLCDGENYAGARVCDFAWVESLARECAEAGVTFVFCGTGRRFARNGRVYRIEGNALQTEQAFKSGVSFRGKPIVFALKDPLGFPLREEELYKPRYRPICDACSRRIFCNGCSDCGACEKAAGARGDYAADGE